MRRRRTPPPPSHERWLVSYADFITLLFAFFTTMYAISTVDGQKLEKAASSMQAAFSPAGETNPASDLPGALDYDGGRSLLTEPGTSGKVLELTDVRARLDGRLAKEVAAGHVDLSMDPRGLVVSMQEAGSFQAGSAELSDPARTMLREVGATLRDIDNFVRVEGHTDDIPIETARFRSNWDLSTARATAVVRFLAGEVSLPATRLSASGYGEFRPRVANDTPQNRARNRRVDLIVLNPATSAAEESRLEVR